MKLYSLKQYNDFLNSKKCKFLSWLGLFTPYYDSPIGFELWLSSQDNFDEEQLNRCNSHNLRVLAGKCKAHLFQKAKCFSNKTGIFLGILVTHEDNYYILMDEYGNKWYESCVGRIEFIKD